MRLSLTSTFAFVAMGGIFCSSSLALSGEAPPMKYRVTVTNVTAGNGVSPFLLVAHKAARPVFTPTQAASAGVAAIAESGDTSIAKSELGAMDSTVAIVQAEGGPIMPGQSRSAMIEIPKAMMATTRLTLLAMIGRSNDSFVALRSVNLAKLFEMGQRRAHIFAQNFDAGSEENTGNVEDFGPGGHPTAQAEGMITYDRGLNPRGNAPDIMAWGPRVASVQIEMLD